MYQSTLLEFLNMGGGEMMLIMVAVLLLFGGKKLPELARGLGKGIREFKDASEGVKREIHRNINSVTNEEDEKKEEENPALRHYPLDEGAPIESTLDQEAKPTEEDKIKLENKSNENYS